MDGITTSINDILKNLIKNFNTLLDCPVRFSGEYDSQKIHNFIEYIEYYKRIKCIGDEQALNELQYLLLDQAHSWWLRRKPNLNTWSEALTVLENQYSKKRPSHVVYKEILKHHYEDYESKDDFIDDKIELFSELSQPELKEDNKLGIIYSLLPNEIQNKVKFANISSIKDLKERLKLIKLDDVQTQSNENNITSNPKTLMENNNALTEVQNCDGSNDESVCQETNNTTAETNADSERDPIIKVRRTQDLMPQDIKEEEQNPSQGEFISNNTGPSTVNNVLQTNHDDFQIDNDIMNQINNIIDESEMNINALNNNQSKGVTSLEFLGFNIEATIQPEETLNKSSSNDQNKSSINKTKKDKIRCSYCRKGNHTAQVCFKKAKHMKLFPERFAITKPKQTDEVLSSKSNEESAESLPSNTTNSSIIITNNSPTDPAIATQPIFSHQISTTSIPYTSIIATTPISTSSTTINLNNIPEKCINSTLTTKLIAPINGKTTNKVLAAKLRCTNTPSPKCHQCGTVGFYKSICPNCSPIYNNNNNHNQYSK